MPIDPEIALGAVLPEWDFAWEHSDVLLYHLALGATELRYAFERDLVVLPTFGVVAPTFHRTTPPKVSFPGIEIDLARVVHAGQEIRLHRPIPPSIRAARAVTTIVDVQDKGTAAVIVQEAEVRDVVSGDPLWTARSSIFAKGEGGFGGRRGSTERTPPPAGPPDAVLHTPTLPQQAMWYRLCGDRNPLHIDPEFAATAGYPAPILHGLCTYGLVGKALVDELLGGDVRRVGAFGVRFAGVVYPGETLHTRVWQRDNDIWASTTVPERDNAPVLADVHLTVA